MPKMFKLYFSKDGVQMRLGNIISVGSAWLMALIWLYAFTLVESMGAKLASLVFATLFIILGILLIGWRNE